MGKLVRQTSLERDFLKIRNYAVYRMHKVRLPVRETTVTQEESLTKFKGMVSSKWCHDSNTNTFYFDCEEDVMLFRLMVA